MMAGMNFARHFLCASLCAVALPIHAAAQNPARTSASSQIPKLVQKDGRWALIVDGAPYLMLGMQVNNSSAWPAMFPQVWPAVDRLHANTVEAPIYWEQFEAVKGKYDFSIVDALLAAAREHKVHLVLLWFGTWKNGNPHYVPEWMKRDNARYPRLIGSKGELRDTMSPFGQATLEADKAAFSALMRHLKVADAQHTVVMVQVENEVPNYGAGRDYSPEATKLFEAQVPADVAAAMKVKPGTWTEAFGAEAENTFQTWSVAHYVEQVARAGKAEYALPLYINHALSDPIATPAAGRLPWDAMTNRALDIWKAVAPSIDIVAPDIYRSQYAVYEKVLDVYGRKDNALFVPETGNAIAFEPYLFAALGYGAIGWSPFGLDLTGYANAPLGAPVVDEKLIDQFAWNYKLAGPMQRELARLNFEGKLKAVSENPAVHQETLAFGPWTATVQYGLRVFGRATSAPGNPEPIGRALVAQLGPDEFLVTGMATRIDFRPTDSSSGKHREFVTVEEGTYVDGKWKFQRIWNGDQTDYGLNFTTLPQVLRVKLMTF